MLVNLQSQQKPLELNAIQYKYSDRIANHLIKAFQIMYSFSSKKKNIWFSQSYLGKQLGLSRNRTCEIVGELEALGFIRKYYREHMTCEYEVVPYYLEEDQRFKVKRFFKSFFSFSVFAIFSINANSQLSTLPVCKDIAGIKNSIQESPEYYRQLFLPMVVWLHYGKEKYQSAGGTGSTMAKSMAPEKTTRSGGTPLLSFEQQHQNWDDEAYRLFESQFLTEMP